MEQIDQKYVTILVTAPPDKVADIGRTLVQEKLVACANIISGVRSIYAWDGDISDDNESLMILKTRTSMLEAVRQRVIQIHPYDVPEIIALPIIAGHGPYLQWIADSTVVPE